LGFQLAPKLLQLLPLLLRSRLPSIATPLHRVQPVGQPFDNDLALSALLFPTIPALLEETRQLSQRTAILKPFRTTTHGVCSSLISDLTRAKN
jgi:hypothetical protein